MLVRDDLHDEARPLPLVADGKGILAADETIPTLTKRVDALGIPSNVQTRRTYREMFFTCGAGEFLSGAIFYDETIRQKASNGKPLAEFLAEQGILPGIKVDTGARPLAGSPGETVTEGLDGLRDRLAEYRAMGAPFCQVARSHPCDGRAAGLNVRERKSARAGALQCAASGAGAGPDCPEHEVLMDGAYSIERCEDITGIVLQAVFQALFEQGVALEAMLLKANMVIAGKKCPRQASVEEVAIATLHCLRQHVPAVAPGIVFLSRGQSAGLATAHLNAMNRVAGQRPWKLTFSYGRALQDPALEAWQGRDGNLAAGRRALYRRARLSGAAILGGFTDDMEPASPGTDDPPHRRDWRDD